MLSIIVPSYNRNQQIESLLLSLEQQTVKNFEVIIVDDCSPNLVRINHSFSFPVQVIRNEYNQGPAESRNIAAKNARYPWLLFLDDDDRFLPQKCEKVAKAIEKNPDINFIYHPAKCEMINEKFTYYTTPYKDINLLTLDNILAGNKIGGMPMLAIKKALFLQVDGLSTTLHALEDYDFVLKLIENKDFCPHYVDSALTHCTFETKVASVSKNIINTEKALDYIEHKYVKTDKQKVNFLHNSFNILAYPYVMSLSRKAAYYYFKQFLFSKTPKSLILAIAIFISPAFAIQLKRFN